LIFEDYRKGLLSEAMSEVIVPEAVRYGVLTALDPKPGSLMPVPGLTVIKPNRGEALKMSGLENAADLPLETVAEALLKKWQPEYLLISLAQDGMALFSRSGTKTVIPTRAKEVFDVSGAGDTVVASYMLALSSGASPEEAAEISNYAAGVVVGKVGTSPVSAEELRNEINFGKRI
jgi:D-beta-D-heptose 7-phosphate kinase/D-beta-D-heptose 1-phosphate adenosyltransferase